MILYDNLKSAVLERRGNQIQFHPRLIELSAHYHFAPRPCQVRAGNQKGRVERAIRYVRDSFWAGRTFTTLAECNRQAWLWRDQVAHQRRWPAATTARSPMSSPKNSPACCLLRCIAFSTDRIETVRSRKTIYVRFDLNDYSIPPEAVGRQLTLVASDTAVRILDGSIEIARHARTYDRHQLVLDPAHQEAVLKIKRKAFHSTPARPLGASRAGEQNTFGSGLRAGRIGRQPDRPTDETAGAVWRRRLRRAIAEALRTQHAARLFRRFPAAPATSLDTAQPRSQPPSASPIARHPPSRSGDLR